MSPKKAAPPVERRPSKQWPHYDLYARVRDALTAVPTYFTSEIKIVGVQATDIFNLNAILGAAIEDRVVATLNQMRAVWDPEEQYLRYSFVRQAQTFPDVLLRAPTTDPILGIELKGWYLLAKEGEPSFRFQATPAVCAEADLFVVFPWHLSEVISGVPKLLDPFIRQARWVAEYRNYHWNDVMDHQKESRVDLSTVNKPYPAKGDEISDVATNDKGKNFGRIARSGVMDEFVAETNRRPLSGISAEHWRSFLKVFKDSVDEATVKEALRRIKRTVDESADVHDDALDELMERLRLVASLLIR